MQYQSHLPFSCPYFFFLLQENKRSHLHSNSYGSIEIVRTAALQTAYRTTVISVIVRIKITNTANDQVPRTNFVHDLSKKKNPFNLWPNEPDDCKNTINVKEAPWSNNVESFAPNVTIEAIDTQLLSYFTCKIADIKRTTTINIQKCRGEKKMTERYSEEVLVEDIPQNTMMNKKKFAVAQSDGSKKSTKSLERSHSICKCILRDNDRSIDRSAGMSWEYSNTNTNNRTLMLKFVKRMEWHKVTHTQRSDIKYSVYIVRRDTNW